ncbi:MAG TPA: helix-turn-helix transcriptional regulator [Verrucomicrobiae bacterium]|nr:helix-turn-helix transcriptional regulator [Verrucomicrobiae bacterium]
MRQTGRKSAGDILRSSRERRGLSLRELGRLAGIDHAYIHRLETGAKEAPSDQVIMKLARALKMPPATVYLLLTVRWRTGVPNREDRAKIGW